MLRFSTVMQMHKSVRNLLTLREIFESYFLGCYMEKDDIHHFFNTFSPEDLKTFEQRLEGQDALLGELICSVFEKALNWLMLHRPKAQATHNVRKTLEKLNQNPHFPFTSL